MRIPALLLIACLFLSVKGQDLCDTCQTWGPFGDCRSDGTQVSTCQDRGLENCVRTQRCSCEDCTVWVDVSECVDGKIVRACAINRACTYTAACGEDPCAGVICPRDTQCTTHRCNPYTRQCVALPKPDFTACDDRDACTQRDVCLRGVCVGRAPVLCTALDQCHDAGKCDPATGQCSNPAKPDGTQCNDGNLCTQRDFCRQGQCIGTTPVTCTALDQCHEVGKCDPATGLCTNPNKPDATPCDDGDLCTTQDLCRQGKCWGLMPVVCKAASQCHDAGVCDPSTGKCSDPFKPPNTPCNDGNLCTQVDVCRLGQCIGANQVTCPTPDQCHRPGTCMPTTGTCFYPPVVDGTLCEDGNLCTKHDQCRQGTCVGSPIVCPLATQCMTSVCVATTGLCTPPIPKPAGTLCEDGNKCTAPDRCTTAGVCSSGPPVPGCVLTSPLEQGEKSQRRHAGIAETQLAAPQAATTDRMETSGTPFLNVLITVVMFVSLIAIVAAVIYSTKTYAKPTHHAVTLTNPEIDIESSARTPIITVNGVLKPTY